MSLNSIQRSAVFTTYNHMRSSELVEEGRLNRALGLAQSQEERPYETTHESCTCPDWQHRISKMGGKCKHQAQLLLSDVAEQADEPEETEDNETGAGDADAPSAPRDAPSRARDIDEINRDLFGW